MPSKRCSCCKMLMIIAAFALRRKDGVMRQSRCLRCMAQYRRGLYDRLGHRIARKALALLLILVPSAWLASMGLL